MRRTSHATAEVRGDGDGDGDGDGNHRGQGDEPGERAVTGRPVQPCAVSGPEHSKRSGQDTDRKCDRVFRDAGQGPYDRRPDGGHGEHGASGGGRGQRCASAGGAGGDDDEPDLEAFQQDGLERESETVAIEVTTDGSGVDGGGLVAGEHGLFVAQRFAPGGAQDRFA
ncbi:hypothetical protein [Frankia sp. Cas4]|uniref:hypothetical protein n=1 Tax=Frankia sp. Cas4 TaxID=3073927 RepID=UPI003A0FE91A